MAQYILCAKGKFLNIAGYGLVSQCRHVQTLTSAKKTDVDPTAIDNVHRELIEMNKQLAALQKKFQREACFLRALKSQQFVIPLSSHPPVIPLSSQPPVIPPNPDSDITQHDKFDKQNMYIESSKRKSVVSQKVMPMKVHLHSQPLNSGFDDVLETRRVENLYLTPNVVSELSTNLQSEWMCCHSGMNYMQGMSNITNRAVTSESDNEIKNPNSVTYHSKLNPKVKKSQSVFDSLAMHIAKFSSGENITEDESDDKCLHDRLNRLQEHLIDSWPELFTSRHDYRIYTQDVIFENKWHIEKPSVVTQGISGYIVELTKFRMSAHMKYANIRLKVIDSTRDPEHGVITLQFRISGLPQTQAFMFWKFLPWKYSRSLDTEPEWMEGISRFEVNSSGFIKKHTLDRVLTDSDMIRPKKESFVTRLLRSLSPKPVAP